jgi:peroxiredoxin
MNGIKRYANLVLCAAFFLVAVLMLPPTALEQSRPATYDNSLQILDYSVKPATLQKNRINFVTIDFKLKKDNRKLQGGQLALYYQLSNGTSSGYFFNLVDSEYRHNTGEYSISFGLLPGNWSWLEVRSMQITDAKGKYNTLAKTIRLYRSKKSPAPRQGCKVGRYAYDFTLIDYQGKKVTLSDYRGKVVFIDFSTMWCPPCNSEAAQLEDFYQKYKNEGLVVFSIIYQGYKTGLAPSDKEFNQWVGKYKFTFPLMSDPVTGVYRPYIGNDQMWIPYNFIIDKKGKLRWRKAGYTTATHAIIEDMVEQLLAEN